MSVRQRVHPLTRRIRAALGGVEHRSTGVAPAPLLPPTQPTAFVVDAARDDGSTDHWLGVIERLAPTVVAHRDRSDRERALPPEIVSAMIDADLGRMMVPTVLGGHQASLTAAVRTVESLARLDGSAGWNAWVMTGHGRVSEYLHPDVARRVFSSPTGVLAGSITATGRATIVDDGYRLSGRWGFGSATAMCDYIAAGAVVFDGETPVRRPDGSPMTIALVLPKSECTIHDTWYTTGLRGTASNDIEVNDRFVDESATFDTQHVWRPLGSPAVYGRPYGEYAPMLMAAVGVGVAGEAIDAYRLDLATKAQRGDDNVLAGLPVVQHRLGQAIAMVDAARSHLYSTVAYLDGLSPDDDDASLRARLAGGHVAERAADAVELVARRAGSSAIFENRRLERCLRDVLMVAQHGLIGPSVYTESGTAAMRADV